MGVYSNSTSTSSTFRCAPDAFRTAFTTPTHDDDDDDVVKRSHQQSFHALSHLSREDHTVQVALTDLSSGRAGHSASSSPRRLPAVVQPTMMDGNDDDDDECDDDDDDDGDDDDSA